MNASTTRRSATALMLSALVTLGILGGIQGLSSQPASDALLARQGAQPQVASSPAKPAIKS